MAEGAKVLETVLAYFMDVLNIIKEFFAKLFPQAGEGEGEGDANENA